jgi:hypothetical protein
MKPEKGVPYADGPSSGARDPYALDDDDDIVMVNGGGDADVSEEPKRSKGKSKRAVRAIYKFSVVIVKMNLVADRRLS